MTEEQKAEVLAMIKAETNDKTSVNLELTPELAEKIEETFRKGVENLQEKQKKFSYHGTAQAQAELNAATKKAEVNEFIRAVARGDVEKAVAISDVRAEALSYTKKDFYEQNIRTKVITSAGSAGSDFLVPEIFETEVQAFFDSYDEIIQDADVQNYNKPGNLFNLNELDTRVTVWASDENSTGMTSSQPSFSEPQIGITDWIGATTITLDFFEDTEVDIMSLLSRLYGEEMAKKVQARLINGDVTVSGVVTKGILNAAGLNQVFIANTAGGYSTVAAGDIEEAFFDAISIDSFQRENQDGKWYMNALTLQKLRNNIRTNASNKDMLSVFDQYQMTLLGKPIRFSNQFPTPATTVSDPFIVYGNLKNHLKIRRKRGMTMKINDQGTTRDGRNLNYQLGRELVVSQRIGHQIVLPEGLTVICT